MVTLRKKSQTDKFLPKSLADLYLQKKGFFFCENLLKFFFKFKKNIPEDFFTRMKKCTTLCEQVHIAHTSSEQNSIFHLDFYDEI